MNKIKVFGSDKKQWTAALLEEIEADQLPAFYGGAMVDPDGNPLCLTKVSHQIRIFPRVIKMTDDWCRVW